MRMFLLSAVGFAAAACQSAQTTTSTGQPSLNGAIQAWVTSGDQRHLLEAQPAIHWGAAASAVSSSAPMIEIDPSKSYQEMVGFGAAMTDASAHLFQRLPEDVRERVMQDLFSRGEHVPGTSAAVAGIGLSFVRVPMGASDFSMRHYSYDDVELGETDSTLRHFSIEPDRAEKLPLLRRALAINPQLKVMASPWSAPAWMKTSNSLIKGTLQPVFYDSFANYFVRFIRAYEAAGVPIYAISLQNEPAFEPDNYPGMRLDPPARARVIANHIGPLFARQGIRTRILDWDHNWDQPQQPLDVLGDTAARKYVQGVAWHCYGGDVSAQSAVHDRYPDKDAYFTECSGGEWSPRFDENLKWTVNTLIIGATRNWARGVLLWNLALDQQYGPHLGGCGNCRGVVTVDSAKATYYRNVEYYALAHASKFVLPDARRIESTGGDSTLTHVAFRNPGKGGVAVIVLNSADAPRVFVLRVGADSFSFALSATSVVTFLIGQ